MTTSHGKDESSLLHYELTRIIIGAFYQVHTELGYGFSETVYRNAMAVLLRELAVSVKREVVYTVRFHGVVVGRYKADLIAESTVVVEVKTGVAIHPKHQSQVCNYLKASGPEVGLLCNFGPKAEFRRLIWTPRGKCWPGCVNCIRPTWSASPNS